TWWDSARRSWYQSYRRYHPGWPCCSGSRICSRSSSPEAASPSQPSYRSSMCTTWACSGGASCAAKVVLPDPAGPSTAITVVAPQRGPAARAAAVMVATAGELSTADLPVGELGAVVAGLLLGGRQLFLDAYRGGAAGGIAGGQGAMDGQYLVHPGRQRRVDGERIARGEVRQFDSAFFAYAHAGAREFVRMPERHPLAHEPLGDVGGQREALRSELGHPVGVEPQRGDHARHGRQEKPERVGGVEHRFLVLLQVPVIRQWERLEGGQQPGQVPDQPPGLAA